MHCTLSVAKVRSTSVTSPSKIRYTLVPRSFLFMPPLVAHASTSNGFSAALKFPTASAAMHRRRICRAGPEVVVTSPSVWLKAETDSRISTCACSWQPQAAFCLRLRTAICSSFFTFSSAFQRRTSSAQIRCNAQVRSSRCSSAALANARRKSTNSNGFIVTVTSVLAISHTSQWMREHRDQTELALSPAAPKPGFRHRVEW